MTEYLNDIYHLSIMSQVSKFLIRPELWDRIFNLFISSLFDIKDKEKLKDFIESFFTPTERIVFAKRLAAAVMIAKGTDYRTIKDTLRISPPTIARMSLKIKYEEKGIVPVIENILRKDSVKILWEEIQELLDIPVKGKSWSEMGKRKYLRKRKIADLKTGP